MESRKQYEFIIKSVKKELPILLDLVNSEYSEEYTGEEYDQVEAELKEALEKDSSIPPDFVGLRLINRIDTMFYRCWLFTYKNRGFVLSDTGNCSWSYVCNAEEALYKIVAGDHGSELIRDYE